LIDTYSDLILALAMDQPVTRALILAGASFEAWYPELIAILGTFVNEVSDEDIQSVPFWTDLLAEIKDQVILDKVDKSALALNLSAEAASGIIQPKSLSVSDRAYIMDNGPFPTIEAASKSIFVSTFHSEET